MRAPILIVLFLMVGLAVGESEMQDCRKPCTRDFKPVCGSNWKTYSNVCGLENAACVDTSLKKVHEGRCRAGTCPKPRVFSHCAYLCDKDTDCKANEKCCSNGCGRDCFKMCKDLRCADCKPKTTAVYDINGCRTCKCRDCSKVPSFCSQNCKHGYKKDKNGCTLCECKPRCPEERCTIPCPNGYMKNTKGCPTCRCRPRAPCPPIGLCRSPCTIKRTMLMCPICVCDDKCPKEACPQDCGYYVDSKGCKKCKCKTNCPIPSCSTKPCPYGRKVNEKGCLTCECIDPLVCPPPRPCPKLCNYKADKDGCFKCHCPFMCPLPVCKSTCKNGYKPNESGCMTCDCKAVVKCKPILCRTPCLTGRMKDKNGCETCQCKLRMPCPRVRCSRGCKIVRGFNGCQKCKC